MKDQHNIILAGFGGQGILFAGKIIAAAGLIEDREVSWLPSYGPEMRGGTANCSVCLADDPIGSPLVLAPDALVVMNQPSLDKFIDKVAKGGTIVVDSSLVHDVPEVDGVNVYCIPATEIAEKNGLKGLANVVCVGKLFKELAFCSQATLDSAIEQCVPVTRMEKLEQNKQAISLGMKA